MKEYTKPLPKTTFWTEPFWEGCKKEQLLIQKCGACGRNVFYPKLFCPFCLSKDLIWIEASGRGKIYSFTVVHSYQPTEFSEDIPYVIGIIELDEGVKLMSNIADCKPEELRCDMVVEVVFQEVTEEFTLPKFRPKRT